MNRDPRVWSLRTLEPLEERMLLAIDVPGIVQAYNDGVASLRQAEEVSAALQRAFGAELDLPMIRENVADALKAVDDLTAPFKAFSVAANATMADVEQQLTAAGFKVEYANENAVAGGDLLRVRYQQGLNGSPSFSFGGGAGFSYLAPENDVQGGLTSGGVTTSLVKATVEFVFGVQNKGDSPNFFVETGGGLRFAGLGASGAVTGNLGIGYLLNVDATGTLRADLSGELVLHTNNPDGRLRTGDLSGAGKLQGALAGNLNGAVTLQAGLTAKTALIDAGIDWKATLAVDFKGGKAVPRADVFVPPSVDIVQAAVDKAVAAVSKDFKLFGGLDKLFSGTGNDLVPMSWGAKNRPARGA